MEVKLFNEDEIYPILKECVVEQINALKEFTTVNLWVGPKARYLILTDIENHYLAYIYGTAEELAFISIETNITLQIIWAPRTSSAGYKC